MPDAEQSNTPVPRLRASTEKPSSASHSEDASVAGDLGPVRTAGELHREIIGGTLFSAGHWVDDALGFAGGWNFYIYLGIIVPFEITALSLVLSYWSSNISELAICMGSIALYVVINVFAVGVYGAAEFWLCGLKVFLMVLLMSFTLVTMCGGNPNKDAFGFRHWDDPAPFLEYFSTRATGRFEGFLTALWTASFTCVGPEFLSSAASEVKHPRQYLKTAHMALFWRIGIFFVGGALAVAIIVSPRDPVLTALYAHGTGSTGSAAASPFIIAMDNLRIDGLPHLITALFATTIFAASNTVLYSASRYLYGLALEGRAPRILRKVTKSGVPIYCFIVTMIFPFLSLLQLGNSAAEVLTWLINVATGATLMYFITALITYVRFHRACEVQSFDRSTLPYKGFFQPYSAWIALVFEIVITVFYGYRSLSPFSVSGFLTAYFMPLFVPCLFIGWKVVKKTKFIRAEDVDLVWEAPLIDAYEATVEEAPVGFWRDVWMMLRVRGPKKSSHTQAALT